jgi:hypothetical protein
MRALLLLLSLTLSWPAMAADLSTPAAAAPATYPEIPYYLRQLGEATAEQRRVELTKIIHDAVVNTDLSDKKTVRAMEPIIAKIRIAMDSGLDRPYLEGVSMWLGSAVDYFDREKLQATVEVPESDWLASQTITADGGRLNITPDKIWLIHKENSLLVAESSNIHEAVITPDGKRAAFVRESKDGNRAEIWTVNMKNRVRQKLAEVASCMTLVLSADGGRIFFQEKLAGSGKGSNVWAIKFSGGKPKKIGEARLIQTVVAKGKHAGALVVYKNRIHHLGTTVQECAYIWDANGRNLGRIRNVACR